MYCSYAKLPAINGQTFTLTLPANLNVQTINWLAVWSRAAGMSLAYVMIPSGLNVPPSLAGATESSPSAVNFRVTKISSKNMHIFLKISHTPYCLIKYKYKIG